MFDVRHQSRKIREPRPVGRKSPSQNRAQRNVGRHRRRKNREPRSFPDSLVAAAARQSETAWTIAHTELARVPSNIGSKTLFS